VTRVNVYRGPARQPGRAQFVLGAGGPGLGAKTLEDRESLGQLGSGGRGGAIPP